MLTCVRGLVQRVTEASVTVGDEVVGAIGPGLCLLVGVTHDDTLATATTLAEKAYHLRVLDDGAGRADRSLAEAPHPAVLVVSQFTLTRCWAPPRPCRGRYRSPGR